MKRWYRFRGLLLHVVAEMERTDRHTHTHNTTTVTLAAHARRGLIKVPLRGDILPGQRSLCNEHAYRAHAQTKQLLSRIIEECAYAGSYVEL